jgi:HK97 family phage major capsid protein
MKRHGLVEQRATKYGRITQIMAQRELTPAEAAEFDQLAAQVDAIDKRLAGVETYVGYDSQVEDPAEAPAMDPTVGTAGRGLALAHASRRKTMPYAIGGNLVGGYGQRHRPGDSDSLRAWLRCGTPLEKPEDRGILHQAGHSANSQALEFRALGTTPDSAGGFTVATSVFNQVSRTLKNYSPIRSLAQILTTSNGEPLRVPRCDDTANSGAIVSEGSAHAEQDAVFSTVTMGAFTYSSKMVRVSNELLADSQIDLARFLGEILGERLGSGRP